MGQTNAACDECRKRKVKCDRLKPCTNCKRHKTLCSTSHVGARPRGHLGGRSGHRESVQARLARLEELLESLDSGKIAQQLPTPEAKFNEAQPVLRDNSDSSDNPDKLHRYIAGPIWSQLSEQVKDSSISLLNMLTMFR